MCKTIWNTEKTHTVLNAKHIVWFMVYLWTQIYISWIKLQPKIEISLQWRHNGRGGVSNHQPHHCLLNRLSRLRSNKTLKLRVTGLCAGNSPETGEFPAQMASNAEDVPIWWRHRIKLIVQKCNLGSLRGIALRWMPENYSNTKSTLVTGNGLVPQGNKPLPEPMLTHIYIYIIW